MKENRHAKWVGRVKGRGRQARAVGVCRQREKKTLMVVAVLHTHNNEMVGE